MSDHELREAGLKVTTPRLKVLKVLEEVFTHHLSAEDIHTILLCRNEEIGLSTIYRVLAQFEAAGLVKRHNFAGGHSIFELEQGKHHDHLVCESCHVVVEFVDEVIERHQQAIAEKSGFKMTDHELTIYGICHNCQAKSDSR